MASHEHCQGSDTHSPCPYCARVSKNGHCGSILLPEIWTSLTSHHSIPGHIERMFRIRFVLLRCPELAAFLTGLPRTRVAINGVGRAQRKAFVRILTAPPTSKGHQSGIATSPLLATRRLHQRHRGIATKAAM